jgi:hypothetical protein
MMHAGMRVALVSVAIILVQLSGCAGRHPERLPVPTPPGQPPHPAERSNEAVPPRRPSGAPSSALPSNPEGSAPAAPPSAAVVTLLDTADQQVRTGNLDHAAAILERALRLEPHNPLLWHRLATLRLQQGQFAQAASLAAKSNALAGNNRQLQASNWDTIAQAKELLGDAAAARTAREKARQLRLAGT